MPILRAAADFAFWFLASSVVMAGEVIVVSTTIQAAVDVARPGDTISIPPGTYRESILINKSDITLQGSPGTVIDATGASTGITVGTGQLSRYNGILRCPPMALRNVTLSGITIRGANFSGIFLVGVDGYRLTDSSYVDNQVYGPFPICSRNGLIASNSVEVSSALSASPLVDAGIYVGGDDIVTVKDNRVTGYAIGIEIENSSDTIIENNVLTGNTCGILVVVLPGLPQAFTDNVRIERNVVMHNNRPNRVPADPGDALGVLAAGTGILNLGGDQVIIRGNSVIGNDSLGVAIMKTPFASMDPRIEPNPDDNEIRGNEILQNGRSPDPVRMTSPGVDIFYDGTGTHNCFARNESTTESPIAVTSLFPCVDRRRLVVRE